MKVTILKDKFTKADCEELRRLCIERVKNTCVGTNGTCLLLSGGVDSTTALYSLLEAGIDFKAYNFHFKDWESSDLKAVQNLQKQIGFDIEYLEIPNDYYSLEADIRDGIKTSFKMFGRLREVKVETALALSRIEKIMPNGSNVISGAGGDTSAGYNRVVGKAIFVHGVDSHWVRDCRSDTLPCEFESVFEKRHKYIKLFDGEVMNHILKFTPDACNRKFPKAIYYYAFSDYHNKYHSYREPKSFHKASNEKAMFNLMAMGRGYKNAYDMFKAIYREMGE